MYRLTEEQREKRNAYVREYNHRNKERIAENNKAYQNRMKMDPETIRYISYRAVGIIRLEDGTVLYTEPQPTARQAFAARNSKLLKLRNSGQISEESYNKQYEKYVRNMNGHEILQRDLDEDERKEVRKKSTPKSEIEQSYKEKKARLKAKGLI